MSFGQHPLSCYPNRYRLKSEVLPTWHLQGMQREAYD
jgi:hypothetical protein